MAENKDCHMYHQKNYSHKKVIHLL